MNIRKDRVLGRGLSALISGATDSMSGQLDGREARLIRLSSIGLNPAQPRKIFKDNALRELADSIRQVGVLQPVLVRKARADETNLMSLEERMDPASHRAGEPHEYCLVAGERRVRAAGLADLRDIPAIICTYEETESLKVALLENIQRENLNPLEEAIAFQAVLDGYGATQEELSIMLGKNRSSVANTLRLLGLEPEIQDMLQEEQITRGHAKVLLGVADPEARLKLARLCHKRGLSVRECEARVQAMGPEVAPGGGTRKKKEQVEESRELRALRERTEAVLGAPVQIERDSSARGNLNIRFYSDDDLLRILGLLGVNVEL